MLLLLDLLGERREVLRRERHEDPVHLLSAEVPHHLLDGEEVAETERRVLREDGHVLPAAAAEVRARGEHVLVALATRPERVLVDPGDRVGRGRARDVEDLVLVGERRELERDPRRRRAGDDLVPLADQVLRARDGLDRVGAVVDERQLDLAAVDRVRALRRIGDAVPQPLDELRAVRGRGAPCASRRRRPGSAPGRSVPRRRRVRTRRPRPGSRSLQRALRVCATASCALRWTCFGPEPETRFRCLIAPVPRPGQGERRRLYISAPRTSGSDGTRAGVVCGVAARAGARSPSTAARLG